MHANKKTSVDENILTQKQLSLINCLASHCLIFRYVKISGVNFQRRVPNKKVEIAIEQTKRHESTSYWVVTSLSDRRRC